MLKLINNIDNATFELKLQSFFSHILFIKIEKSYQDSQFSRESFEFSFTKSKKSIIISAPESFKNSDELIIIILEIDHKPSELVFSHKISRDQTNDDAVVQLIDQLEPVEEQEQQQEVIPQLKMITSLFGTQDLEFNESNINQSNEVFENFGKGFLKLFSQTPTIQIPQTQPVQQIQPNQLFKSPLQTIQVKNELQNITFNIKKKII